MENLALWYRRFGEPETVLQPETAPLGALAPGHLRVQMLFSPVNASDLIPITGAYRHRTPLPAVAGYEGVGIVTDAPASFAHLLGKRVLPLRGQGTWQRYVDCPAEYAIPVPDAVDARLAARAYINPLAAQMMLTRYPPEGKRVLLTAAGSDCAILRGSGHVRQERKPCTGSTVPPFTLNGWRRWVSFPSRSMTRSGLAPSPHIPTLFTMPPAAAGGSDPQRDARAGHVCLLRAALRANVQTATARAARGVVPYPKRSGCAQR